MHTVFRVNDIKSTGGNNRLFQVNLTPTGEDDKQLHTLTERIREDTFPNSEGWYRLGKMLIKLGQSEKALRVYEVMLEQCADESEKGRIHHLIGWAKYDQGEYGEAIMHYEKAIDIYKKTLSPTDRGLANAYDNIGLVYSNMGEYSKALPYYEKDREILQQSVPSNHPDLAKSYGNIGNVYKNMGEYSKALSSHEKTLEIQQQSLPSNHPNLASSYNNIGLVYSNMGEYSKAHSFYERAVNIAKQSLPANHPHLQWYENNLERIKKKL